MMMLLLMMMHNEYWDTNRVDEIVCVCLKLSLVLLQLLARYPLLLQSPLAFILELASPSKATFQHTIHVLDDNPSRWKHYIKDMILFNEGCGLPMLSKDVYKPVFLAWVFRRISKFPDYPGRTLHFRWRDNGLHTCSRSARQYSLTTTMVSVRGCLALGTTRLRTRSNLRPHHAM